MIEYDGKRDNNTITLTPRIAAFNITQTDTPAIETVIEMAIPGQPPALVLGMAGAEEENNIFVEGGVTFDDFKTVLPDMVQIDCFHATQPVGPEDEIVIYEPLAALSPAVLKSALAGTGPENIEIGTLRSLVNSSVISAIQDRSFYRDVILSTSFNDAVHTVAPFSDLKAKLPGMIEITSIIIQQSPEADGLQVEMKDVPTLVALAAVYKVEDLVDVRSIYLTDKFNQTRVLMTHLTVDQLVAQGLPKPEYQPPTPESPG